MKKVIKQLIKTELREVLKRHLGIVTLIYEHNSKTYKFDISEAERVEMDHEELVKLSASFKEKLSDKEYLMSLVDTCGFKEADFEDMVISFEGGNAKLTHNFMSLPAGVSCPMAGDCLSFYNPEDGKLYISKMNNGKVCYAAAKEAGNTAGGEKAARPYRKMLYTNFYIINNALKSGGHPAVSDLINRSMNEYELNHGPMSEIRIHEDGDFYSQDYFKAWVQAAVDNPQTHFYFYTKSVTYLVNFLRNNSGFPSNFEPTVSSNFNPKQRKAFEYYKDLAKGNVKIAKIYNSYDEVPEGVPIDRTDAYAMNPDFKGEFALVYHGTGLKGTEAAKFAYRNARDDRKKTTVVDKQYYLTTVKTLRTRMGDGANLQINLNY